MTRSTSFSKPFTCISYVSSTTLGTTLTQKIDKMNKTTLKSIAKQMIQCKNQIEVALSKNKLDFQSMLTPSELTFILKETDSNLTLDQFN